MQDTSQTTQPAPECPECPECPDPYAGAVAQLALWILLFFLVIRPWWNRRKLRRIIGTPAEQRQYGTALSPAEREPAPDKAEERWSIWTYRLTDKERRLAVKQYRKLFQELDMPGGPAWVARYFDEEPGVGMTERAAVDDLCRKKPRLKGMRIERKR